MINMTDNVNEKLSHVTNNLKLTSSLDLDENLWQIIVSIPVQTWHLVNM